VAGQKAKRLEGTVRDSFDTDVTPTANPFSLSPLPLGQPYGLATGEYAYFVALEGTFFPISYRHTGESSNANKKVEQAIVQTCAVKCSKSCHWTHATK
jgi:hypothetical protein